MSLIYDSSSDHSCHGAVWQRGKSDHLCGFLCLITYMCIHIVVTYVLVRTTSRVILSIQLSYDPLVCMTYTQIYLFAHVHKYIHSPPVSAHTQSSPIHSCIPIHTWAYKNTVILNMFTYTYTIYMCVCAHIHTCICARICNTCMLAGI